MLGGSSSLNFLMMVYPSKASIDAWGALGNQGWDFDTLAPYYRKFATTHPPSPTTQDTCRLLDGRYSPEISVAETGPLTVTFGDGFGLNNAAWFDTFQNIGLTMATDVRTGTAGVGAFQQPATIDPVTKTRTSAASAYLTPEVRGRQNLTILTNTVVKKVVLKPLEGSGDVRYVAKGVEILSRDGSERVVAARGEVVLAAGALHTPQILELSGIGCREVLERHGVPVVIVRLLPLTPPPPPFPPTPAGLYLLLTRANENKANPNVGENMQDHPIVVENFEVADGVVSGDILRHPEVLQAVVAQYQAGQGGPLSQSIISTAYVPSKYTPLPRRRVYHHFL